MSSVDTVRTWERSSRETAGRGETQAQAWARRTQERTCEGHREEMARASRENQERVVP